MMGTGKSTIGEMIATKLNMPFVDLDKHIEFITQKSITDLFETVGETHFREIESEQLKQINNSVISCGGGIILREDNCNFIQENGTAILLTASTHTLSNRLKTSTKRPLLTPNNTKKTLTNLWLDRRTRYVSTADMTIETDGKTPDQITSEIISNINL